MNILLVDDDEDGLALLEMVLARKGLEVTTASSWHQARERLSTRRFDAVVTDVDLGDGDGRTLESLLDDPRILFVVLSGSVAAADFVAGAAARSHALLKPVDVDALMAILSSSSSSSSSSPSVAPLSDGASE